MPIFYKPLISLTTLFVAILSGYNLALAENNLTSDWYMSDYSQARAHILQADENEIKLAVEIKIVENYKTYWQSPGSAGVPPLASFTGKNIVAGSAEIKFPHPHKYVNKYGETWGYKDKIVLFMTAKKQQQNVPSTINLSFDYAVCDVICLPEHAEFTLHLNKNKLAATMASLKFSKYRKQIAQPIELANAIVKDAKLNANQQLVLTFNRPTNEDIFITDKDNRFYQLVSSDPLQNIYSLHGLPVDADYQQSSLDLLYKDNDSHYNLSIKLN
ncbi:MAG: protein-disulfide reductase DsbD family protein [Hyphomicrobiales bacterium]